MHYFKKIYLSPTSKFKTVAPNAIGSVIIYKNQQLSLNLFNLPNPAILPGLPRTYLSWFCNPTSGQVEAIGSLSSVGENLYILYDVPHQWREGFSEIIITAEATESTTPAGDILLIGYLALEESQPLEPFEPFNHPLERHRWWKEKKEFTPLRENPKTIPCSSCRYWFQPCPGQIDQTSPTAQHAQFNLPTLIGLMMDENGNIQYMIHGIPGRLLRTDQPDQGRTGYLYWQPYYGFSNQTGAMGYWLCYIDPRTNQIQTPMGVTIPPG